MLNRRDFLRTTAAAAAAPLLRSQQRKPNFLILLADDMGFSDAGCFGGEIETPNIDRLATTGLRFTQGYSTARCGPSRSSLLTGYYAQQTACDVMTRGHIPNYARLFPDYLKPLGYRTYHSGKWHIKFTTGENGAGFDHSYTLMDESRYFDPHDLLLDGERLPQPTIEDHYYTTTAIADYAIKFLREHAREHASQPFFLYYAPHSPHFPLQAPQEDIEKYKDKFAEGWDVMRRRKWERMRKMGLVNCALPPLEPDMWTRWNSPDAELFAQIGPGEVTRAVPWATLTPEQKKLQRTKMAIHAAMVTRMDIEIGRILDQIRAMGAERDTVIFFTSDNGASSEQLIRGDGHDRNAPPGSWHTFLGVGPGWAACSNAPLRLYKSWVNEGGIAAPLVVRWLGGIQNHNQLRHDPCHFVDVLPTIVDLAGGKTSDTAPPGAPPVAGCTLAPAFQKDGGAPHDFIYFNHNFNRALRVGDWKLISTGQGLPRTYWRDWDLYDMRTDRCEMVNMAAAQQDRVKQMDAQWTEIDTRYAKERDSAPDSTKQLMARGRRPNTKRG